MGTGFRRAAVLLWLTALLAGCAAGPAELPPAQDLAQALAERAGGREEMTRVPEKVMRKLLMVEPELLAEGALVMDASRATTTQFAVLTARDGAAAKRLEEGLRAYQDAVLEQYRNYVPGEVPRIEKALIRRHGAQAVFVICDDPALAEQVLNECWK